MEIHARSSSRAGIGVALPLDFRLAIHAFADYVRHNRFPEEMMALLEKNRMGVLPVAGVVLALIAAGAVGVFLGIQGMQLSNLKEQVSQYQADVTSLEQRLATALDTQRSEAATRAQQVSHANARIESLDGAFQDWQATVKQDLSVRAAQAESLASDLQQLRGETTSTTDALSAELEDVRSSAGGLKVAYINAEDAFTVFTNAVQELRQKALDKQQEISELQQQFLASKITKDYYQEQNDLLQVQLLQAQLNIDIGTIDKLIWAPGFGDMKSDLQKLKDEAQPVVDEMKNLVSTVQMGVVDPTDFQNRYTQVKNAFSQLDQLLTQAATSKIVQAAQEVAIKNGYDLVLRVKNVIVYRNATQLVDITPLVERELSGYL